MGLKTRDDYAASLAKLIARTAGETRRFLAAKQSLVTPFGATALAVNHWHARDLVKRSRFQANGADKETE
jgi:hypothetical protein